MRSIGTVTALKNHQVDAVVFDSPAILGATSKDDTLKTSGDLFSPQKYGIAMRNGSPLREPINRAILALMESDRYRCCGQKAPLSQSRASSE